MKKNVSTAILENVLVESKKDIKLLLKRIDSVGDLLEVLKTLPQDALLNPFGDPEVGVAFDEADNICYIDNIDYLMYDLMETDDEE